MSESFFKRTGLDPERITIIPLGIGNAFTSLHYHTSFLVACGGRVTLVDAPSPLRKIMREAGQRAGFNLDLDDIDNLLLTHLHGDHCNGVEEIGFWRRFLSKLPKPRLYILPELQKPLWENRLGATMAEAPAMTGAGPSLSDYFDVHDISPGKSADLGVKGLVAEVCPTRHFVPCVGLRIAYNGRSIGYSADTEFETGLMEFLSTTDFIMHETGESPGHTPLAELSALPDDLKKKIRLTHLPDTFDASASEIAALEEGRVYVV